MQTMFASGIAFLAIAAFGIIPNFSIKAEASSIFSFIYSTDAAYSLRKFFTAVGCSLRNVGFITIHPW